MQSEDDIEWHYWSDAEDETPKPNIDLLALKGYIKLQLPAELQTIKDSQSEMHDSLQMDYVCLDHRLKKVEDKLDLILNVLSKKQ